MKKILLVGEHPLGHTGNSGMMRSILSKIDFKEYLPIVFSAKTREIDPLSCCTSIPFGIIEASDDPKLNPWGEERLVEVLSRGDFDAMAMIGVDIWRYAAVFRHIKELQKTKRFNWSAIFPFDLQEIRRDMVTWIQCLDFPYVYSQYGIDMLKEHVPNIKHFRPPLQFENQWVKYDDETRGKVRTEVFPGSTDKSFIFGFVGVNQYRKDPVTLIRAYNLARRKIDNIHLYLHCEPVGSYNMQQLAVDMGLNEGQLLIKPGILVFTPPDMVKVYNSIDCLVNCAMQEGLSWTPLEAMLCGTPVIASRTTAQTELVEGAGVLVPCNEPDMVPIRTEFGEGHVDAKKCCAEDVAGAMVNIATNSALRSSLSKLGLERGKEYIDTQSDVNEWLGVITERRAFTMKIDTREDKILFAQHSAAGDILMTTRCLKGLKDRHPGKKLVYMTQQRYADILTNNPNIDELVLYDKALFSNYKYPYNPHGEVILPGHWGRNCNSILSDFYWKILRVEPSDFFIERLTPALEIEIEVEGREKKDVLIVHTTGGDSFFRVYKYMEDVVKELIDEYYIIQIGGADDYPAEGVDLDLRGKLTFRESAWVMSKAKYSINVDSFISHLAGALGVSQVVLFGSGNYVVCQPKQIKGQLICMSPDYVYDCPGLGPCSGSIRDCPAPCTGRHNPKDVVTNLRKMGEIV